jgi:hypothetical protein
MADFPATPEEYLDQLGLGPVELGSILFTLVEPHAGWEVAYNRWYERDHFYAGCMVGAHNFAGARWVAPTPYKALRHVVPGSPAGDDPRAGSYLSLYWVEKGHHQEWNQWAYRQFKWLHDNERMFPHREHVHTLLYEHDWARYRDHDPVPAVLALDHRFTGLAVVIGEASGSRAEVDRWYREECLAELQRDSAIAMTLSFSAIPLLVDAKDVDKDADVAERWLHLHFLDADPAGVWMESFADHPATVEESGLGRVVWQGPFIPTVPGTDTYARQL